MKLRIVFLAAIVAALGGAYAYHAYSQKAETAKVPKAVPAIPEQTVAAEPATVQSWQSTLKLVGDLRASRGAELSLQVSGIIHALPMQSGAEVKAGETILQLNADDQIGRLKSLKATAKLNAITLARDMKQLKINAVSQAVVDIDKANSANADALVEQQEALVAQYTLKAPFAGRLGIRVVDLGQYVSAGMPIVTLQSLDPIYADFYVPQRYFSEMSIGTKIAVEVDSYPGEVFEGSITVINPKVESGSRNIKVRASLANPDSKLMSGMFVKISLKRGKPQMLVTLPQTAIVANPFGSTVFVLEKAEDGNGLVAKQRLVKTGDTLGDLVSVVSGVEEGEMVVTAGQLKLRNGTPVIIDNTNVPKAEADPKTAE